MSLWPRARLAIAAVAIACSPNAFADAAWAQPRVEIIGGDASEVQIATDGQVTHRASGFVYPQQLGDMPLRKVQIYGEADVSVDYSRRGGGNGDPWLTFYVYPASVSFDAEVAGVEQALTDRLPGRRIEAPAAPPATFAGGHSGWYRGSYQGVMLTSGYMIVQRDDWLLKARFSIPDEAGPEGIARTVTALAAAPWDWTPAKAPPRQPVAVAAR